MGELKEPLRFGEWEMDSVRVSHSVWREIFLGNQIESQTIATILAMLLGYKHLFLSKLPLRMIPSAMLYHQQQS